ncbi:MAG: CCA tRNA nucleotidyltransferase [Planctomycetota bacterium]|nr:MAG: CCA tRNA nucleotidyltransferase [Planctomycetota bacterium]
MRTPSVRDLPAPLAAAARGIAEALAARGKQAWIVGGTVRDLALARVPKDVDMATDAVPEEVEAAFERTVPVGRAFGVLIVPVSVADRRDVDVELATFRSESGYTDARRPDEVTYGSSVEEDASRRDFTCNALFLEPLRDEFRDPAGGLADLAAGILRTVGDSAERFREDGLRLLRMARFQAAIDLAPAPGLHAAARAERDALRGVSAERVLHELERVFTGPRSAMALRILDDCGLLERALPRWRETAAAGGEWTAVQAARLAVLDALPDPPGLELGLAALLEVEPLGPGSDAALAAGAELARLLRTSRATGDALAKRWTGRRALARAAAAGATRAERIRAVREPWYADALALARAWGQCSGEPTAPLDQLAEWRATLAEPDLFPAPFLHSDDLAQAGIARGPEWGRLLREAETLRLEGAWSTREEALAWLRR